MSDAVEGEELPPGFRPNRERAKRLVEMGLLLAMLGVLAAIIIPNIRAAEGRNGPRACYANQKTVIGAIEMYNLDKNTKRTALDPAFFAALHSGGYLQSIPDDPGAGPGSSNHYVTRAGGNGITCTVHGPIQ